MPKYLLTYKGEATDNAEMSAEDSEAVLAAWGEWIGRTGPALVDVGSPLAESTSMIDDGTEGAATSLSGYSIVQADDLQGAKAHVKGHPYLSEGKGNFAVDIYEIAPMPEM